MSGRPHRLAGIFITLIQYGSPVSPNLHSKEARKKGLCAFRFRLFESAVSSYLK
jgi:hypothetical protein